MEFGNFCWGGTWWLDVCVRGRVVWVGMKGIKLLRLPEDPSDLLSHSQELRGRNQVIQIKTLRLKLL